MPRQMNHSNNTHLAWLPQTCFLHMFQYVRLWVPKDAHTEVRLDRSELSFYIVGYVSAISIFHACTDFFWSRFIKST